MAAQSLTTAMQILPSAADGVAVTPSGVAWSNSSWVQLTASTSSAKLLAAICLYINDTNDFDYEIDIGTGGAGSETVIATLSGSTSAVIGGIGNVTQFILPIPIDNIANAARVATRVRLSTTSVGGWKVAIQVVAKPITGTVLTTANRSKAIPSSAAHTTLTYGSNLSAWSNTPWSQLTAATAAAWVVFAVSMRTNLQFELDIGTGGAGSETVIQTIHGGGVTGRSWYLAFPNPLDNIANGVRVALRARMASSTVIDAMTASLTYLEKPL